MKNISNDKQMIGLTIGTTLAGIFYWMVLSGLAIFFLIRGAAPLTFFYITLTPLGFCSWPLLGLCLGLMKYQNPFWYGFLVIIILHYFVVVTVITHNWQLEMELGQRLGIPWTSLFIFIYLLGQFSGWWWFSYITQKQV